MSKLTRKDKIEIYKRRKKGERVPTNWTEKIKTVWRYIFLWEEKVNSH